MENPSYIVAVAHDSMKPELKRFLLEKKDWLWGRKLVATEQTAQYLEQGGSSLDIRHVHTGSEGGYRELEELVSSGQVRLVFFFRDPEIVQDYAQEVTDFVKSCVRADLPLAVNPSSAELLILGLIKSESAQAIRDRSRKV